MTKTLALLALITFSAVGCSGSGTQELEVTGTIAFTRGDHVWLMSADGSGQRRLARGYGPSWSPDGRTIAFSVDRRDETSQVYVIGGDGRGRLRLTRPESEYDEHYSPAWSPDGGTIAFQGYNDGNYWLSVVRVDGGGQRALPAGRTSNGREGDVAPVWSGDGRTILFTYLADNAVYAMRPDGSGRRVLARIEGDTRYLVWSPDRRRFTVPVDADLWVMSAAGKPQLRLFDSPIDNPERCCGVAWSPDGQKIAFTVVEGKGQDAESEIYVVGADGNGLRKLTDSPADDVSPTWSPDGRAIAFVSDRDGNREIYVMDADGSDQRNLSRSPGDDFVYDWSPRTAP